MQPLDDIRVLDVSRVYAAPAGAMTLGDLGADVIRVEPPGGSDSMRDWGPFVEGESTYYMSANRNKRSVTINLKDPEGKRLFLDLVKTADVVIENFKTGTMENLGVGYETLKEENPGIILCSVTGFGHTGPLSRNPGFDPVIQAMSGLIDVTGHPDKEGTKVGIPIADIITSSYVVIGVLAALRQRERTGEGQAIDLSLLDVQMASMANVGSAYLNTGMVSKRLGNQHNNVTPYQVFQTADDPIMICAGNDGLFAKLADLLGHPEWATDPQYRTNADRKKNEKEIVSNIQELLYGKKSDEWLPLLQKAGVPAGRVNTISQALEQEQVVARGGVESVKHPKAGEIKLLASPLRFSNLGIETRLPPPGLGEHNEEVFGELYQCATDEYKAVGQGKG
ncbi:CaiB/BaiF CoA transferase family protein [Bhargavaea beijingensis]|uniref:CoA transferase n=1 Tax=Bhargavaea beijingensis TaxID=426756 RepID=A0ABX9ZDQ8_9BACL|nr:CoA transferase [Bhargavaea beijingensis]RSK33772.1 CoA transferase [Bhargavaea beijingensis]